MPTSKNAQTDRPQLVTTIAQLRQLVGQARIAGKTVGLVPTMGALHEGHLSLARASAAECDVTIVTIFVNPTQFAPGEDFDKYPRTLEADLDALADCDVDLVFAPSSEEVYPAGSTTAVEPPHVALRWEGQCRPGHFRGVTMIVLKLFNMAMANVAYFGQKDYQQALAIRHMVRDLNVPIRIRVCPIVREPDGLAMSSRNRYLDDQQRRQALALSAGLRLAERGVRQGKDDAAAITAGVRQLLTDAGIERIDYVALANPDTLEPVTEAWRSAVALIAAYVGDTRLIDNCLIERP